MNGFLIAMGFIYGACGFVVLNVALFRWITGANRTSRPVFPHITSDTLGIGPRNDGRGNYRCDSCQKLKPVSQVTISPGDGYVECIDCETK